MNILLIRKILFYLFVLIYIIFCPLIIFRALGILYKPSRSENLIQTGLISISTIPSGATVIINGIPFPETTPTFIRNLTPGAYNLKVVLPRYRTVEKTVFVYPSQATRFDPILLVPHEWRHTVLSATGYRELLPLSENPFLLVSSGDQLENLFIYRWQKSFEDSISAIMNSAKDKDPLSPLFPKNFIYLQGPLLNVLTRDESPFVLVKTRVKDIERYFWVDTRQAPPLVKDISDLFTGKPTAIIWNPDDSSRLFSLQNNNVHHLNIEKKAIFPNIVEGIRAFTLYEKKIYTLTQNGRVLALNADGSNEEAVTVPPRLTASINQVRTITKFSVFSPENIFLLVDGGALLSTRLPGLIIDRDCQGYIFSPEKKRILVWTKNRIGVINLDEDAEGRKLNNLFVNWLYDKGKRIDQAFWVNKGSHILLLDQGKISLVEAQVRENPLFQEILQVRKNSPVYYSDPLGRLFFFDDRDGALVSVTILPPRKPPAKTKNGQPRRPKE